MRLSLTRITNTKGQMAAVINLFLATFAVFLIATFCFELSRYFLAREELTTSTEAAALCCETALVSSGDPTNATNQTNAANIALTLFQQNTILGQSMSAATSPSIPSDLSPSAGQAQICFQFQNPVPQTTNTTIAASGSTGTTVFGARIKATGAYCYTPAFPQFLGLGNAQFVFQVSAYSGVPRIDVVIGFDMSGSEDDQTPISPLQKTATTTVSGGGNGGGPGSGAPGTTQIGGVNPCNQPVGAQYLYVAGANGQSFTGGTMASFFADANGNHPSGGVSTFAGNLLPNVLYPFNYGTNSNPGTPVYTEADPNTKYLVGYRGDLGVPAFIGAAPGNTCLCAGTGTGNSGPGNSPAGVGMVPKTSDHNNLIAVKPHKNKSHAKLIASTIGSIKRAETLTFLDSVAPSRHQSDASRPLSSAPTDSTHGAASNGRINAAPTEDLLHLCAKIDAINHNKNSKKHADFSQVDDQLSKLSFTPLFANYQTLPPPQNFFAAAQSTTTSNISSQQQTAANSTGSSGNYLAAVNYNGYSYTQSSAVPGGQGTYPTSSPIPGDCPQPGNISPVQWGAPNYVTRYTDIVPNFDGSNGVFSGNYTDTNGYFFYDTGTIRDAIHGDLDGNTVATNSFVNWTNQGAVVPTAGYSVAAYNNTLPLLQPMNDLFYAAYCFCTELQNTADAHFSFIAFNDTAGNANTGVTLNQYSDTPGTGYIPMVSSWFPYSAPAPTTSGTATYIFPALPYIGLSATTANTDIMSQIPQMNPNGDRNVAALIQAAITEFQNNSRIGANRALIIFTDGVPTSANESNSAALQAAISQAQTAAANGITIYVVGVADPASSDPTDEDNAYNDNTSGICFNGGPRLNVGPRWYRVNWAGAEATLTNLSTVVDNIVRQMVGTVQTSN